MRRGPARRWLLRGFAVLATAVALVVTFVLIDGWNAFGARATDGRLARIEASPEWAKGHFVNPQPIRNNYWRTISGLLHMSADVSPKQPVAVASPPGMGLDTPPGTGLRVTWLGHSTVLVEIDGQRILLDPVWGQRASPLEWAGPQRWFPPPIPLADLPPIDAVLISHDHYDHLDRDTIVAMKEWNARFIVPLGVGAHLAYWGVPEARIVEVDWWQHVQVGSGGLEVVSTPARHASGRMLVDDDATLWTGYALLGAAHRVYYSGDTGLFPGLREIGRRLGPFDLTIIEVGQYGRGWPDWHLGPEQAVRAHQLVGGRVMLPVHWGAFALASHGWTEPIERALAAGSSAGVTLLAPRPGQPIEPSAPPPFKRWWPSLPWKTGLEDPIVASQMQ
jgi:L-ascorbate metabolism protein UlaG (beta-lactamase superfamily)